MTVFKEVHPSNALAPTFLIPLPNSMYSSDVQSLKASPPKNLTEPPILTSFKEVQFMNAPLRISFTESDTITLSRLMLFQNAYPPIDVIPSHTTICLTLCLNQSVSQYGRWAGSESLSLYPGQKSIIGDSNVSDVFGCMYMVSPSVMVTTLHSSISTSYAPSVSVESDTAIAANRTVSTATAIIMFLNESFRPYPFKPILFSSLAIMPPS